MRKSLRNLLFSFILILILTTHFIVVIGSPLISILSTTVTAQKNALQIILKNEKTNANISYIQEYLAINRKQMHGLAIFVRKLSTILPINSLVQITDSLAALSLQLPQLLGDGRDSNFVVLFLNNYELRPGGGFIGSLGFITLNNYSITRFEVQDVYEIDGQARTHHEPHFAVRKYLNQPNEFLRDSNFSPDFSISAQKALRHLSYVPAYNKPYVAVIGITASAFEDLLRLTGPIELNDYNTTITSSNFFTTTQRKIESEFFPGSKQKRSILQSLGNVMRQKIEEVSPLNISNYIHRSVSSKNLVFFSPKDQLQAFLTMLHIAGSQDFAYDNWIMPVDANVGINKMDALVHKTMELQLLREGNSLAHTFTSTYTNTITADASEKESYKNYFQLYAPKDAVLKKVFLNGLDVGEETISIQENGNSVFGIYFETPPASRTTVSITYNLPYSSKATKLHFQKQIGSKSSPLTIIQRAENTKVRQLLLEKDEVFSFF